MQCAGYWISENQLAALLDGHCFSSSTTSSLSIDLEEATVTLTLFRGENIIPFSLQWTPREYKRRELRTYNVNTPPLQTLLNIWNLKTFPRTARQGSQETSLHNWAVLPRSWWNLMSHLDPRRSANAQVAARSALFPTSWNSYKCSWPTDQQSPRSKQNLCQASRSLFLA